MKHEAAAQPALSFSGLLEPSLLSLDIQCGRVRSASYIIDG